MIIKQPVCYDVSHWKEIRDFSAIDPRPFLMITKATEGISLLDDKFIRFFQGMKSIGCHRGAYHFHRKAYSAVKQADLFIEFIRPHIDDNTLLFLDVEEGGESAAQLMAWMDRVQIAFPRNRLGVYSAKRLLDPIPMTAGERAYFKTVPVWTAGYPYNPDNYSAVPGFYVPDQTKFGPVILWQYSEKGQITGIQGDVDLNWISPTFQQLLGGVSEPQTGETTMSQWYKVTAGVLNIRNGPGASYTDVGDLVNGDIIEVIETIGGWHHIDNIWRGGEFLDCPAVAWCSGAYVVPTTAPVVTPPPAEVAPTEITVKLSDGSTWKATVFTKVTAVQPFTTFTFQETK